MLTPTTSSKSRPSHIACPHIYIGFSLALYFPSLLSSKSANHLHQPHAHARRTQICPLRRKSIPLAALRKAQEWKALGTPRERPRSFHPVLGETISPTHRSLWPTTLVLVHDFPLLSRSLLTNTFGQTGFTLYRMATPYSFITPVVELGGTAI